MLGAIDRKRLLGQPRVRLVRHLDHGRGDRTLFAAVLVIEPIALPHHRFEILVDGVNRTGRVHPTATLVETLVDKKLSPRYRPIRIQPFIAGHLQL